MTERLKQKKGREDCLDPMHLYLSSAKTQENLRAVGDVELDSRSYNIETAIITSIPNSSIPENQSLKCPILEVLIGSFWSWRSSKRSRYVGSLFKLQLELLSSIYCLRYSDSHAAWSDVCHKVLLHGNGSSAKPPHCDKPDPYSMLNMWMMITRIIAVLLIWSGNMSAWWATNRGCTIMENEIPSARFSQLPLLPSWDLVRLDLFILHPVSRSKLVSHSLGRIH
jgi:hypothetical protein